MRPDERARVDRLVLAAAALEGTERSAYLDALPAEDRDLEAEVRRRLRAAEALPEGFLEAPATALLEAACAAEDQAGRPAPDPPTGDERYEIGECLGTGGMAHVYRALDRQLGRPVALKVLHTTGPETARRLLREARAQARVRHDHVLDVYETGELGGRPYIAVRSVDGGTLAELASGDDAREAPSLETRVRLLAQVAEGLHAAHREGLLHGDVKPSNVLVEETPDGELKAWIGDFGIATGVEGADPGAGGLAGTPRFMAPELLAGGDASPDRRSDVYSLGVTLFQVLTGELPPRTGARWGELREQAPKLPPDLTAIVSRCLAAEPAGRYPSARAVAEDLRRFLDGEVVEAYADRRAYRLSRFAARHRTLLGVVGVAAVLLAAALVAAAVLGIQAIRANERAADRRLQAEDLIGFMLVDLRDKLEPVGHLDLLDDVGERAMGYFAAVPEAELSDAELARRSMALYQIGDVRMRRGDLAGAERPLEESLALARRLAARDPDDAERLFDLGQSEFWVGYASWRRGDLATARNHFEAYHEISRRLVARAPEERAWRRELSYAESNLGSVLEQQGELAGALGRFGAALEIDRSLVADAPTPEEADDGRFELAATHNTVGVVLETMGRLDEARHHYEADLKLRQRLVTRDPENQRWREFLGTSHEYLGNLLATRGEITAARPHLEAARDLFDELAARDPGNGVWRYKRAWSHLWLGRLEHAQGRMAEAREAWRLADGIARELAHLGPERTDWRQLLGVARYHAALGRAEGAPDEALAELREALAVLEPWGEEQPDDRKARRWLAEALVLLGDVQAATEATAARRAWERAAEILAPMVAGGTRDAALLTPWVRALERLGRPEEAAEVRAILDAIGAPGGGVARAPSPASPSEPSSETGLRTIPGRAVFRGTERSGTAPVEAPFTR